MTSLTFAGFVNGAITWAKTEFGELGSVATADLDAARAHFKPTLDAMAKEVEVDAQHLAATVQADGLQIISNAAAAFQGSGNINDAVKAALVGLQAAGKDVTKISADALTHAVAAAQTALPPAASA